MKRYKVSIDTMSEANKFILTASKFPKDSLRMVDSKGHEVSAQSLLGVLYSFEWDETFLYAKEDVDGVYEAFADFVIE